MFSILLLYLYNLCMLFTCGGNKEYYYYYCFLTKVNLAPVAIFNLANMSFNAIRENIILVIFLEFKVWH